MRQGTESFSTPSSCPMRTYDPGLSSKPNSQHLGNALYAENGAAFWVRLLRQRPLAALRCSTRTNFHGFSTGHHVHVGLMPGLCRSGRVGCWRGRRLVIGTRRGRVDSEVSAHAWMYHQISRALLCRSVEGQTGLRFDAVVSHYLIEPDHPLHSVMRRMAQLWLGLCES